MKQTTEQQNTLREPERVVVDWVGWLRNTTTRVVVQHQFWYGARDLAVRQLHCTTTHPDLEVITLREWNERNAYAPVNEEDGNGKA